MTNINESKVRDAFKAHEDWVKENLETITLRILRNKLEEDLGLEADSLKPFKKVLEQLIDELMTGGKEDDGEVAEPTPKKLNKKKTQEKKRKSPGSDAEPAPKKAPRQYSKRVEKLKGICRQATITIPPTYYVKNKNDDDLVKAILSLLEKNGLDEHSGQHEIIKAKAKLQLARDLDGIDTSNIVQGGRRGRVASFKPIIQALKASDDEEESETDSDSESSDSEPEDDNESAGVSPKKSSDSDRKAKGKLTERVETEKWDQSKKPKTSPNENSFASPQSKAGMVAKTKNSPHVPKQRKAFADWSDDD